MTRPASDALATVLTGSFQRELVMDVVRGSERLLEAVPVSEWSFDQDIDGEIKTSADCTISYSGDFADSYSPRDATDALAPFGSEAHLYCIISAGPFSERIPLGPLRIESVPEATDTQLQFRDRLINVGSLVKLNLLDRLHIIRRARFRTLEQAPSTASAWAEIGRLTQLPLSQSLPDTIIPSSVVYGRDRLEAVQTLAALLGGTAYIQSDGSLTVLPDAPAAPFTRLQIGDEGTVLDAGYSLHSEDVYNVVVGDFEDAAGNPIHKEAVTTLGDLAVTGPYGENVVEYPYELAELVRTPAAAQAAVDAYLEQVSAVGNFTLDVQCIFDPRLELGDVVEVERRDHLITGRIRKASFGRTGPMSLTLGVLNVTPL